MDDGLGGNASDLRVDTTMQTPFEIAADLDTPVSAFLKLAPLNPTFLLESVEQGSLPSRYSFLGLGDGFEVVLDAGVLRIGDVSSPAPLMPDALMRVLRNALKAAPALHGPAMSAPFTGGLVGAAAFDAVRLFEPCLGPGRHAATTPFLHYRAPTALLVFDHATRRIGVFAAGGEQDRLRQRDEIVRLLQGAPPSSRRRGSVNETSSSFTRAAFEDAVRAAQGEIAAGEVYQLVLSNQVRGKTDLDPFQVYRTLRLINPSSYMFFLRLGAHTLVGASPEALVRLGGGEAELRPIAGTRRRGATPAEDDALARELLADEKERAEHIMLVDLARNDLGRVARPGAVRVHPLMSVERYSHVMHLVSGVTAAIGENHDAFDLFAAALPAGTLSGAPKIAALRFIDAFEPVNRGFYGGALGYFSADAAGRAAAMDQAIVIRAIVFSEGEYTIQSGAGIVANSDPSKEWQEVEMKAAAMRAALARAAEGLP